MDRTTERTDLLDVLGFIEALLQLLTDKADVQHRHQCQRVWRGELKKLIGDVQDKVRQMDDDAEEWDQLKEVGWTGEQLRLKNDVIASTAGRGLLGKALKLVNSALGSLIRVFSTLEPVKEYKDFLETLLPNDPEPVPYITTLFGAGPVPAGH